MNKKYLFFISILSFVLAGCIIQDCRMSPKRYAQSFEYLEHTPLTVAGLHSRLLLDTTHYKIVYFYGEACTSCSQKEKYSYFPFVRIALDTAQTRMYWVLHNCGGLPFLTSYWQNKYVKPDTTFFMRDTLPEFYDVDNKVRFVPYRMNNIASALYPEWTEKEKLSWIPMTFVSDKYNRLKMAYYIDSVFMDNPHCGLLPMQLEDLMRTDLSTVDFGKVDTIVCDSAYYRYMYPPIIREWDKQTEKAAKVKAKQVKKHLKQTKVRNRKCTDTYCPAY